MKKGDKGTLANNIAELKEKLDIGYLIDNTSVFRRHGREATLDEAMENLDKWLKSWITPLIEESEIIVRK